MIYPPLQHGLAHHLSASGFTPGGQSVYVGVRPVDDGWVIAVIRIDDCMNEAEAVWLGSRIRADVLTHLRFANQESVPDEAVDAECGVPQGSRTWSLAVYVTVASSDEAAAMREFFEVYVDGVLD